MESLEEIRAKIDEVDERMAELFAERIELARKAAEYKRAHGLPAEDAEREVQILERGLAIFETASERTGSNTRESACRREDYIRFQKAVLQISKDAQKR